MIVFDKERSSNVAHFKYFLDTGSTYVFSSAHVAVQFICKGNGVTNAVTMIDEMMTFNVKSFESLSENGTLKFQIMPQPVHDVLVIAAEIAGKYTAEIFSAASMRLIKIEGEGFSEIDVAHLPMGMYVLKLYTDNGSASRLFIKQ